jgi:hypothetical protein
VNKVRVREIFKRINKKNPISGHEWTEHSPTTGYEVVGPCGLKVSTVPKRLPTLLPRNNRRFTTSSLIYYNKEKEMPKNDVREALPDFTWWLRMAEELAGKPLHGLSVDLDFPPVDLEKEETILIHDLENEFPMALGFRMSFMILKKGWRDGEYDLPSKVMDAITDLLEGMDKVFCAAIRIKYPRCSALGLRMNDGKIAVVSYPSKMPNVNEILSKALSLKI